MKLGTKIGIGIIVTGVLLSTVGGVICMASPKESFFENFGEKRSYEEKLDVELSSLQIEAAFLNIELKTGDKFEIIAEDIPEKLMLSVSDNDGKVKISNESDFSFKGVNFGKVNGDIIGKYTIYIPDEKTDKIEIDASFCNFVMEDVESDKIDIDCNFGEYNITDTLCNNLDADFSFSNAFFRDIECEKLDVSNSFGNIDADDLSVTDKADFDVSFVDMNIGFIGNNYYFSSVNTFGSVDAFSCPEEDVRIDVDITFGNAVFSN